ncbi:extracellular solute-binding protein [Salinicola peritrichatus]|uniref:extracellular solute-binding protein n=1 Tax=Salinicola peritrichatus TaxID=1267424 RepID=UPI001EF7D160|nr:extracellular solute-binding protein [Salinicola peritrichatus]
MFARSKSFGIAFLMLSLGGLMPTVASAETLNALFMSQASYNEDDIRSMTEAFTQAHPGVDVNLEFVPYEGLRNKTLLASNSSNGYDVVLFDVIWTAEYAQRGLLEDVSERIDPAVEDKVFPGAWTTVVYDDKYYGMPWTNDSKLFFYNKAMLSKAGFDHPPRTWQEVADQAETMKEKGIVEYPLVWSWPQAEAVVCDYTTLLDAFGGRFLDDAGKPAFQKGGGLKALDYMVSTLDNGITNPNSTQYLEEDVRRVFSSGKAAFALNWSYMYDLANDPQQSSVVGDVGIMAPPGVEGVSEASGVNGSMGLGVTSNSQHPDLAWQYVQHMASPEMQNSHAERSLPIWVGSFDDPDVVAGRDDLMSAAEKTFTAMIARPTLPNYQEASNLLQVALQQALLGDSPPQDALNSAADQISNLQ